MNIRNIFIKFINSRKLTWILCSIGWALALVSMHFLPSVIPVHFSNGYPDDFGKKIEIFIFPIIALLVVFLTGREKIKYFLTHSRTFLADAQFNWMIDGVILITLFAEVEIIYASFV